jgi:hypothetical protein
MALAAALVVLMLLPLPVETFCGLKSFGAINFVAQRRRVMIILVPSCLRPRPAPLMVMTPGGALQDIRGHPIDFDTVGGLLKGGEHGTPCVVDLALWDEQQTPLRTLFVALAKLRQGKDSLLSELHRGPANAIVFVRLKLLDPLLWWPCFWFL